MELIRRNPTHLHTLQNDLNRMFDSFFTDTDFPLGINRVIEQANAQVWAPKVDISEDRDAFRVHAELPGLAKNDIKVNIENNLLTIEGERKHETQSDEKKDGRTFHRVERSYGRFHRAFRLPQSVDSAKVEAKFANGVLELTLPKTEAVKPKQIEVKIADALPLSTAEPVNAN